MRKGRKVEFKLGYNTHPREGQVASGKNKETQGSHKYARYNHPKLNKSITCPVAAGYDKNNDAKTKPESRQEPYEKNLPPQIKVQMK